MDRPNNPVSRLLAPASVHHTFAAAALLDVDALKTTVATSLTAVTYSAAGLNGVLANPGPAYMRLPQAVSVTSSTEAACYNTTDPIIYTGTDFYGDALVEELLLTAAGGAETIVGNSGFYSVTSIYVPAMLKNSGAFTFGVRDIVMPASRPARQIRHGSAGNILVGFVGDDGTALGIRRYRETVTGKEAERHDGLYQRIYGTASTTSTSVTVYV